MSWKQIMMERSGRSSYSDGSEMKKLLSEAKEMLAETIEILEEVCEHTKEVDNYPSARRAWRIEEQK